MSSDILKKAIREKRETLTLSESLSVASSYGLPVPKFQLAKDKRELVEIFKKLKKPLVAKVSSPDLTHKTEVGGVKLNIKTLKELELVYEEVIASVKSKAPSARIEGVVIQEMVKGDYEVIVGGLRDPQFGPTIAFGMGGVLVEILKDISFELAPISEREAYNLINRIRGAVLLRGYRGKAPADLTKLAKIVSRASQLIWDLREYVKEMDLNPIMISGSEIWVVDARFVLELKEH